MCLCEKWRSPAKHEIQNAASGPEVAFVSVRFLLDNLWGNIHWRSNFLSHNFLSTRKPKIDQLNFEIFSDHKVVWLYVSVAHSHTVNIVDGNQDLLENLHSILLW